MPEFNPDDYLAKKTFDPDAYLAKQEPTKSFGDKVKNAFATELIGKPEAGLSMASSIIAEPVAGLAGLASMGTKIVPKQVRDVMGIPEPGTIVDKTREALTYKPRSESGQQIMGMAGKVLEPIGNAFTKAENYTGDIGYELAGPVGGAVGASIPTAASEALGVGLGKGALKTASRAPLEAPKMSQIRQGIETGDRSAVGWKLENNRVVKDPVQIKVLDEGFDPSTVMTAYKMNPTEKVAANKILNRAERYLANRAEGAISPPAEVIGDSLMNRVNTVLAENKKARIQQKQAIQEISTKRLDAAPIVDNFDDALNQLGVERILTKQGQRLDFKNSLIEGNSGSKHLQWVFKRLDSSPTGKQLQDIKDYLDDQIDFDANPMNQNKMDRKTIGVMKDLRGQINDTLRASSKKYAQANDTLSETITVLNDFGDTMGSRFDINSENAANIIGQQTRKLLSNYGVGPDMMTAIGKLDAAASKYGKTFNDNPIVLAQFYSDLEKRFGSFKPNSFQGNIEKANLSSAATNLALGNPGAAAADAVRTGIKFIGGRSGTRRAALKRIQDDKKAIRAMRELLKEG